jgi:hypothetical protein
VSTVRIVYPLGGDDVFTKFNAGGTFQCDTYNTKKVCPAITAEIKDSSNLSIARASRVCITDGAWCGEFDSVPSTNNCKIWAYIDGANPHTISDIDVSKEAGTEAEPCDGGANIKANAGNRQHTYKIRHGRYSTKQNIVAILCLIQDVVRHITTNGNHTLEVVTPRTETIAHAVMSDDEWFAKIAVPTAKPKGLRVIQILYIQPGGIVHHTETQNV